MNECPLHGGECGSHFNQMHPSMENYKVSKHFSRDIENSEEIIKNILSCEHSCFTELHKFEKKIDNFSIFRAKIDKVHIVYAVDDKKTIFFLRAFKSFRDYTKFLENEKEIRQLKEKI